jgi:uncharacterized membrane-anchored protein
MNFADPYTIIGIAGMILIMIALWRTSSGRWHHSSVWYELDTIVGASLIIVYQIHVKAFITLPINIFLVIICFRGLSSFAERYAVRKKRAISRQLRKRTKQR